MRWHFGAEQELKMCDECGNERWERLLGSVGRLGEWLQMVYGRRAVSL